MGSMYLGAVFFRLAKGMILFCEKMIPSLKLTFSHLKMDGWNISFRFGTRPIFRSELLVSGSVHICIQKIVDHIIFTIVQSNYKNLPEEVGRFSAEKRPP